ncbi:hypothetical protein GQX74_002874 [Glossina fuscipes]|nr:hypothetical protein GQX74_002874 [Glossina fuscipes]
MYVGVQADTELMLAEPLKEGRTQSGDNRNHFAQNYAERGVKGRNPPAIGVRKTFNADSDGDVDGDGDGDVDGDGDGDGMESSFKCKKNSYIQKNELMPHAKEKYAMHVKDYLCTEILKYIITAPNNRQSKKDVKDKLGTVWAEAIDTQHFRTIFKYKITCSARAKRGTHVDESVVREK